MEINNRIKNGEIKGFLSRKDYFINTPLNENIEEENLDFNTKNKKSSKGFLKH